MDVTVAGFEIALPVVVLGAILGMTYGILAVGLVLVYRTNRILNFAHGEIGAFGAAVLGLAVVRWHVPYWVAFVGALAVSAALGGLAEVAVVRRLRSAPRMMSIVATLGVAQFLLLLSVVVNDQVQAGSSFPEPAGLPRFDIGGLRVTPAHSAMLFLTPLLVAALLLFLRRGRLGIGMRAAAANADAARLAGIRAARMSTLAWALAGAVSAFAASFVQPTRGFVTAQSLGPGLLVRALAAALLARMTSLPVALAAGVGLGIVEQQLVWNTHQGGLVEMVLFVVVLGALLVQSKEHSRVADRESWAVVQSWRSRPAGWDDVWLLRHLGALAAAATVVVVVVLVLLVTNSVAITFSAIAALSFIGLSIGIVSGLGGLLSLGQLALAGVGATVSIHATTETGNFFLSFALAGLVAGLVSVLVGLPALRIRGVMLAATTLSFALAAESWLFQQRWMLSRGVEPGRPIVGSFAFESGRSWFLLVLGCFVAGLWVARNVWHGGFGRRLRALRDNEDNARAFAVPATLVKVQAFALAGVLAGVGGALYGHTFSRVSAPTFNVAGGINIVAMALVGGIGVVAGPLVGALYVIGVPRFLPLDAAGLAATSFGWLVLILYFPGGIVQMVEPVRTRLVDALARGAGLGASASDDDAPAVEGLDHRLPAASAATPAAAAAEPEPASSRLLLEARHLRKHFDGVRAVDDVSIEVREGEILGLIGPNGAGKTTLFELLGGFTAPDEGTIRFDGVDVTRHTPEARARLGLIRSFQDAALFPTFTVLDTVRLAFERRHPSGLAASLAGAAAAERHKGARADELLHTMGLGSFRDKRIAELSTGTRRITELACLLALDPVLLLLDEPSSGIAQRESEALGELLRDLKARTGATMIVIEHDMPLVMGLSDRVVAMDSGRVLTVGTPAAVRADERVVESYLGAGLAAIERSGTGPRRRRRRRPVAVVAGAAGPEG